MVDDGIWVNKVMVLMGMAWWFDRYALMRTSFERLRWKPETLRGGCGLNLMLWHLGIGNRA